MKNKAIISFLAAYFCLNAATAQQSNQEKIHYYNFFARYSYPMIAAPFDNMSYENLLNAYLAALVFCDDVGQDIGLKLEKITGIPEIAPANFEIGSPNHQQDINSLAAWLKAVPPKQHLERLPLPMLAYALLQSNANARMYFYASEQLIPRYNLKGINYLLMLDFERHTNQTSACRNEKKLEFNFGTVSKDLAQFLFQRKNKNLPPKSYDSYSNIFLPPRDMRKAIDECRIQEKNKADNPDKE